MSAVGNNPNRVPQSTQFLRLPNTGGAADNVPVGNLPQVDVPARALVGRVSPLTVIGNALRALINTICNLVSRIFSKKEYEVIEAPPLRNIELQHWGGWAGWGEELRSPAEQKANEIRDRPGEIFLIEVEGKTAIISSVPKADFETRAYKLEKGGERQHGVQALANILSGHLDNIHFMETPERKAEAIAETLTVMAQNYGAGVAMAVWQEYQGAPAEVSDSKYFKIEDTLDVAGDQRVKITAYMTWNVHEDDGKVTQVETARSFTIDARGVLRPETLTMTELPPANG